MLALPGFAAHVRRHAWLALVAGAGVLALGLVDFAPPSEVRVGSEPTAALVGDAPTQSFAARLQNPQSVQLRASLRLLPDDAEPHGGEGDRPRGQLLSQPVMTTILGMPVRMEQLVRLGEGDEKIEVRLSATPRLGPRPRRGRAGIQVEYELTVSRWHDAWWRTAPSFQVHLQAEGIWSNWDDLPPRLFFRVGEHAFALDLELSRPSGSDAVLSAAARAP